MFDANFIADPYPTYQYLLAQGPIQHVDYMGGAWLVPHYDDALTLLRDPRLSAARAGSVLRQFPPEQRDQFHDLARFTALWMLFIDGPDHLRLRRLLAHAFTPRTIESLRPAIQDFADTLIELLLAEATTHGQADLLYSFAHPLPVLVIAQLLGVSAADQPQFIRWSDDLALFLSSATGTLEMAHRAQDAARSMVDYFRTVVAARRREPHDDFVTLLINAEEQGDQLSEEELLAQCTLFLIAGHETTRNFIGNGVLTLLRHPEQLALLRRQPELIRGALDEIVRYESPLQVIPRIATEDFELYGQQIRPGQIVLIVVGAGNRDPQHFSDPDRFDITRAESRSLSFGHGPHICIGMALAYLETEIALTTLLRRLPTITLASEMPDWTPSFLLRGLQRLPIRIEPQSEMLGRAEHAYGSTPGDCPFHRA